MSTSQPPGGPPEWQPPPPPTQYVYAAPAQRPSTNGMAVAAMVTGILSIVICCAGFVLGIIAVVLGGVARKQIAESQGQQGGSGMATAGLVTGIIGVVIWGAWLVLYAIGLASLPLSSYS